MPHNRFDIIDMSVMRNRRIAKHILRLEGRCVGNRPVLKPVLKPAQPPPRALHVQWTYAQGHMLVRGGGGVGVWALTIRFAIARAKHPFIGCFPVHCPSHEFPV